jgi:hypothetical protein
MYIEHNDLEKLYLQTMNECIKDLPEYEDGMMLIHIGSGFEVQIHGVTIANPQVGAMLSVADKLSNETIRDRLSQLKKFIKF